MPLFLKAQIITYYSSPSVSFVCGTSTVTDFDGNVYNTLSLGTQCWTSLNLKTTHYTNGSKVVLVTDPTTWEGLSTGARCFYDDDSSSYKPDYGDLYNFYAVSTGNLCPSGWHVPTAVEWTTLAAWLSANYYGCASPYTGADIAKSMASFYYNWHNSAGICFLGKSTPANNSSGLTIRPGGDRYGSTGTYGDLSNFAILQTSDASDANNAYRVYLFYNSSLLTSGTFATKKDGYSVRCIKN